MAEGAILLQKAKKKAGFVYFRIVKNVLFIALVGMMTVDAGAQVIFRNDFLINNRSRKVENLGLRFISINVSNYPNWNQLINGRGGGTLLIDVRALREPRRKYSYREIAEKVYVPATVNDPRVVDVPQFLLQEPPRRRFSFPARRTFFLSGEVVKL
jgi:hypothetical protein